MRALFGLAIACCPFVAAQAASRPQPIYVVVGEVTQPDGQPSGDVRRLFMERLRQRADVTLDTPVWLPDENAAMGLALFNHGMRAYNASMQIESARFDLVALPQDPTRATLTYSARVRIFGFTLPSHELRIGGEGEAESSVIVRVAHADVAREQLSREVIDAAMQEAMAVTVERIRVVAARERAGR